MTDKEFIELTEDMSPEEILNYYRNLYYNDGNVTERGIVANAINDLIATKKIPPCDISDVFYRPLIKGCTDICTVSGLTKKANGTWKIRLTSMYYKCVYEIEESGIGKDVFRSVDEAIQHHEELMQ